MPIYDLPITNKTSTQIINQQTSLKLFPILSYPMTNWREKLLKLPNCQSAINAPSIIIKNSIEVWGFRKLAGRKNTISLSKEKVNNEADRAVNGESSGDGIRYRVQGM